MLATGRMPIRIQGGELNRWSNLPADETTLGDMFSAAGYATAYIGKWGTRSTSTGRPWRPRRRRRPIQSRR